MLSLPDAAAIRAALKQPLDPRLYAILADELATVESLHLENLTYVLVIQPGDTEEAIQQEIGWSPLVNPISQTRFGTREFAPYWAGLENLGGWYALTHPVGNDGFAYILITEDAPDSLPELLRMCRHYAGEGGRCAL